MTLAGESTRSEWVASLRASPVLRHLAEERLRALLDGGELERFAAGVELVRADDSATAVHLIVDGACEVQRPDGVVKLEGPALVGDVAALTGVPGSSTVRTVADVSAVVIDRDRFLQAVRSSAAAGQELTELAARGICAPGSIRQVGRFPVDGVMGEGGSGVVLRARHPLLGVPVALKMLSHARALSPDGAQAFIGEASLLMQLEHPGIVRVLDAFEALGTFFMVMPWIEGATLRAHLDAGVTFGPEQVLRVADEGLSALAALHGAGLVHRDVKPSNLVVNASGRLVLIDLGIACARGASAPCRQLVGSPGYCSPEQILWRPVDGRSDVYSLGCTLYELVFGRPPFDAPDVEGALDGHLRGTPNFDVTPMIDMGEPFLRWLRRCLSRTRANRPDAAAARLELRQLLPPLVANASGWQGRPSAAFPVVRETVEWRVRV